MSDWMTMPGSAYGMLQLERDALRSENAALKARVEELEWQKNAEKNERMSHAQTAYEAICRADRAEAQLAVCREALRLVDKTLSYGGMRRGGPHVDAAIDAALSSTEAATSSYEKRIREPLEGRIAALLDLLWRIRSWHASIQEAMPDDLWDALARSLGDSTNTPPALEPCDCSNPGDEEHAANCKFWSAPALGEK